MITELSRFLSLSKLKSLLQGGISENVTGQDLRNPTSENNETLQLVTTPPASC